MPAQRPINFATIGGSITTWYGPNHYRELAFGDRDVLVWECRGCEYTGRTGHREDANRHAAACRALDPGGCVMCKTDTTPIITDSTTGQRICFACAERALAIGLDNALAKQDGGDR